MGRAIALALAGRVSGVAVHYRGSAQEAAETVAEIERGGTPSVAFGADITDEAQAEGLVRKVEATFGRLDILVNNVGPFLVKPWQELNGGDWDAMFRAVLESAYFCMKAALPGMGPRVRRVVNIGCGRADESARSDHYALRHRQTGLLILTVRPPCRGCEQDHGQHGLGTHRGDVMPPGKIPPGAIGTFGVSRGRRLPPAAAAVRGEHRRGDLENVSSGRGERPGPGQYPDLLTSWVLVSPPARWSRLRPVPWPGGTGWARKPELVVLWWASAGGRR
jgi:3-oxoacyl-[acyl-carrier protein] reductase